MKVKKVSFNTMKANNIYMAIDMNSLYIVNKTYGDKNSSIIIYKLFDEPGYPIYSSYIKDKEIKDISSIREVLTVYDLGKRSPYKKFDERMVFSNVENSTKKFINFIENL